MKVKHLITLLSVSSGMFVLTACGNQPAQSSNQNPPDEKRPTQLPQEFMAQQNQRLRNKAAEEVRMHQITQSLKKSYAKLFNVKYDQNLNRIILIPENKQVKTIIKYADKKNESAIKNWQSFVKGVKTTSKSVSKSAKSKTARLTILHPKTNKVIYEAANGHELYEHYQVSKHVKK